MHGLAQDLVANGGRIIVMKHEAKAYLTSLMHGSAAGTMDDLNWVLNHELFANSVSDTSSEILARNPHVCMLLLMHVEELVAMFCIQEDTVAGLQRFAYAHFPPVCHKILPSDAICDVDDMLSKDEEGTFSNNIAFDDAASACANVLLSADCMLPYKESRSGSPVSRVTGHHPLPWKSNAWTEFFKQFNDVSDTIRCKSTFLNTSKRVGKLNKYKTKVFKLLPTIDVLDKVCVFLLKLAGVGGPLNISCPETVRILGGVYHARIAMALCASDISAKGSLS
jgi:hypothetical protein